MWCRRSESPLRSVPPLPASSPVSLAVDMTPTVDALPTENPYRIPGAPPASSACLPPPMSPYMQAAFAAAHESRIKSKPAGYDECVASMKTSWELDAEAAAAKAWLPARSYEVPESSGSVVRPAPAQPALVTAMVSEHRRGQKAYAPAAPSKPRLTSWEHEAQLLRRMHLVSAGSLPPDSMSLAATGSASPRPKTQVVSERPPETSELRRLMRDLDSMWAL